MRPPRPAHPPQLVVNDEAELFERFIRNIPAAATELARREQRAVADYEVAQAIETAQAYQQECRKRGYAPSIRGFIEEEANGTGMHEGDPWDILIDQMAIFLGAEETTNKKLVSPERIHAGKLRGGKGAPTHTV